jgi:hypothetical protein
MQTGAVGLLTLVLWTTQSNGSNLPVGSAQDFHVAFHQDQELALHRPSNVLKLSPCGEAIEESILHSPAFGTLHVKLGPGASLRAEAGVMVCMQVRLAITCVRCTYSRPVSSLWLHAEHRVRNGASRASGPKRARIVPTFARPRAVGRSVDVYQRVSSRFSRGRPRLDSPCARR